MDGCTGRQGAVLQPSDQELRAVPCGAVRFAAVPLREGALSVNATSLVAPAAVEPTDVVAP
jgi:hypothetical protein